VLLEDNIVIEGSLLKKRTVRVLVKAQQSKIIYLFAT
jgi:hypothetical protein